MIAHFLALKQNAKVSALQLPRTLIRVPILARMVLHLQNVLQRLLQALVQESAAHLLPLHRSDLDSLLLPLRTLLGNEYLSPVHYLYLEMTHLTM
jgi:glycerol-3-phosphate O-acyltransferase